MEFYSKTDIGLVRKINQDAVESKTVDTDFLWSIICDGMGGTNGGDVASSTAIKEISEYLCEHLNSSQTSEKIKVSMYNAIESANTKIFEKARSDKLLSNMGTTVVLGIVKESTLHVMYAGDSRVYVLNREHGIKQITKDHSVVQEMVDRGEITRHDAKNHPQKNIITRALGVDREVELDYIETKLKKDDIVLLCTDGLTNEVDEDDIYSICMNNDISKIPEKLVRQANKLGGRDNITVSITKI